MISEFEWNRMIAGELYCPYKVGDDVVIGSGSVVTKDIPSHVIAAGNPCKVIREITEKERQLWKEQYQKYIDDSGKK